MSPRVVRLLALLALVAAALSKLERDPLVREFDGSYPDAVPAPGPVREFALRAAPIELPLLDDRPLAVWAYNGSVPGPALRVRLGERVRVTFTNALPEPTTIHWHGVRVPNAMDGVPGVTQPPIPPGGSFVYEFTPKDAGTFWFHPHLRSSEQIERGLYGTLVVDDADAPAWSRDVVWVLDDWLVTPEGTIYPQFNTRHDLAHDGRWGNVVTVNGHREASLVVRPGERLRLRLVNVANGRVFAPDLGGLDARVIAVDGLYAARPLDPRGFELAPGNRLDLDVTIPPSARGSRFPIIDRFTRQPFPLATIVVADEGPVETPTFPSPAAAHIPSWRDGMARPLRADFRLNAQQGGPFGIQWMINGMPFAHEMHTAPPVPTLLPLGAWSRLRFTNESYRLHPMHIHGLFFKVLARNGTPVDEQHWRDTVLLHAQETVDVGAVPLDPGQWMLHCHILEHAESGMMTLVEVR